MSNVYLISFDSTNLEKNSPKSLTLLATLHMSSHADELEIYW